MPPCDGAIVAVPPPSERVAAVVGFTGHILVAASVGQEFIDARLGPWELSGAFIPPFLSDLMGTVGRLPGPIDTLLLATALSGPPPLDVRQATDLDHPRVHRARRLRTDATVWVCSGGVVILGRGVAGRREVGLEVDPAARGRGLGRALATTARHLADGPLWAQITPGNAASVRAFLAAGYRPVGQEVLFVA
jgi:GNAT superfamily N-acetyltransferase